MQRSKVIIIEGVDRVGKTTLAGLLSTRIGAKIFKDSSFFAYNGYEANVEKVKTFVNMAMQMKMGIICDRSFITEYVYSKLERNNATAEAYLSDCLWMFQYADFDVLYVYVKASDIKLSSNLHGKDLSSHSKLYDELYEAITFKKIACDWFALNEALDKIEEWYNE